MALTEEEKKERRRAYDKQYREKNKDRIAAHNKEYFKTYYDANKDKRNANGVAWRKANKDSVKVNNKAYYEANGDKIRAYNRDLYHSIEKTPGRRARKAAMARGQANRLTDGYVTGLLTKNGSPLTSKDVPQSLIELKRLELKLKRNLKEQDNG